MLTSENIVSETNMDVCDARTSAFQSDKYAAGCVRDMDGSEGEQNGPYRFTINPNGIR
jgi:hypothetical protein